MPLQTVHTSQSLVFRKIVEIEHFVLREAILDECQNYLDMGRQMYFYYLEWLFVYNQNNVGYLQITTLQFHYF